MQKPNTQYWNYPNMISKTQLLTVKIARKLHMPRGHVDARSHLIRGDAAALLLVQAHQLFRAHDRAHYLMVEERSAAQQD